MPESKDVKRPPAGENSSLTKPAEPGPNGSLQFVADVELLVSVELGRNVVEIDKLLDMKTGTILPLTKLPEEPLDVRVNNKQVAQGEAVIVNDKFGVRVTQIVTPEGELETLVNA